MKEYITIGQLGEHFTYSVWVGTDAKTRKECTVSINGFKVKDGWQNIHVKVKREDLVEYVQKKITLLRLMFRRLPDSLIIQDVNVLSRKVTERRYVQWPKDLEGMFDTYFCPLYCVDYKGIGEWLGVEIGGEEQAHG